MTHAWAHICGDINPGVWACGAGCSCQTIVEHAEDVEQFELVRVPVSV